MPKKFSRVYQFKIVLNDTSPPIERVIQVPEGYTFWALHVAIQDAMGWFDYHLHEFTIAKGQIKKRIGIPDDEFESSEGVLTSWEECIADYFSLKNPTALYEYDFGDGWEHSIELQEILERHPGVKYPRCVSGQRACPPEDCGGSCGYERLLDILSDKKHEEHKSMLTWLGGKFDPNFFDPKKVKFDNPEKRLELSWGD